jgi:hypothetical protein
MQGLFLQFLDAACQHDSALFIEVPSLVAGRKAYVAAARQRFNAGGELK